MNALTERIKKIVEAVKIASSETRSKIYDELGEIDEGELFSFWRTSLRTGDIAAIEQRFNSFTEVRIGNVERALAHVVK